ncbi:helix-turn-helix domain-containing protein [Haladaptatus sp. DFWS20]|uniref:helix-turn-helix domain-containing protein n=1 Tax=Haladaptatus sp. DFWS20 TaxID=3403467 RepID=UPI003EB8578F
MTGESPDDTSGRSTADDDFPPRDPRLRLEFHSDNLAKPFQETFDEPVTITVNSVVQLADGTHLQYWTVTHTSPDRLCKTVVNFPTTLDARLLSTVGDTHRIEVHGDTSSLFSAFDEFDGDTKAAVYDENGVHVVAEFPSSVKTDMVVDAVHDIYPDLDLVSSHTIQTVHVFRHVIEDQLTDRQLTALRIAYFSGYYEQPRMSTGEELAERMGISKQAFHEHLRKAYATIFEHLLENSEFSTRVDQ